MSDARRATRKPESKLDLKTPELEPLPDSRCAPMLRVRRSCADTPSLRQTQNIYLIYVWVNVLGLPPCRACAGENEVKAVERLLFTERQTSVAMKCKLPTRSSLGGFVNYFADIRLGWPGFDIRLGFVAMKMGGSDREPPALPGFAASIPACSEGDFRKQALTLQWRRGASPVPPPLLAIAPLQLLTLPLHRCNCSPCHCTAAIAHLAIAPLQLLTLQSRRSVPRRHWRKAALWA
jgi:hypothetical protein